MFLHSRLQSSLLDLYRISTDPHVQHRDLKQPTETPQSGSWAARPSEFESLSYSSSLIYQALSPAMFIAGPNTYSINMPCQVCFVTVVQDEVMASARMKKRGGEAAAVHQWCWWKRVCKKCEKSMSQSGLQRHWVRFVHFKTAAWDDACQLNSSDQKKGTTNFSLLNVHWIDHRSFIQIKFWIDQCS